jgi:hypothetical protein
VREAFFVSFLTQLGVEKEPALATGFLFFVVTTALAIPGALVLAWEHLRPGIGGGAADASPLRRRAES